MSADPRAGSASGEGAEAPTGEDLVRAVMRELPTYGDGEREWTQAEAVIEAFPKLVPLLGASLPGEQAREDFEQLVTDILVALSLDDRLVLRDGPDVDDAREAVMQELLGHLSLREAPLDVAEGGVRNPESPAPVQQLTPEEAEALNVVLERVEVVRSWDKRPISYPALESAKVKLRALAASRQGEDDG